jgi:hypothetical protein
VREVVQGILLGSSLPIGGDLEAPVPESNALVKKKGLFSKVPILSCTMELHALVLLVR